MIPALMVVFALGGTTYGMAEESLAFYALVITVLIAAGYDALTARWSSCSAAGSAPSARRSTPSRRGSSGFAGVISDGLAGRLVILIVGLAIGVFFVLRADRVKADPSKSVVYDLKEENEERFQSESEGGAIEPDGHAQADPRRVRPRSS